MSRSWGGGCCGGQEWDSFFLVFKNSILLIRVQGYRGMEVSIFEVLFFLTLLVYTAPHIMVFGAVNPDLSATVDGCSLAVKVIKMTGLIYVIA